MSNVPFIQSEEKNMKPLLFFDIPKKEAPKEANVTFVGGFQGVIQERFRDAITQVLISMLKEFREKYPKRVFENCPADLRVEKKLISQTEKIWTDGKFVFVDRQYQKLRGFVSVENVGFPWEQKPCKSVSFELLNENGLWHGDVAEFINDLKCARIIDIGENDDDCLFVLRDFDKAISRFSPKIRLSFEISLEIANPANGKIIQWRCCDIVSNSNPQFSLGQYAWQLMNSAREPIRFGGFHDFEEVVDFIRAA